MPETITEPKPDELSKENTKKERVIVDTENMDILTEEEAKQRRRQRQIERGTFKEN